MQKIRLFIRIVFLIIVVVSILYFNQLTNHDKYSVEKNNAVTYLKSKYSGLEFSVESIGRDPYDGTYLSEIKAQKSGQRPFVFQVREHAGLFTDSFVEENLGQDARNKLFEVLGNEINKIIIEDISVTRSAFASYGITEKNYTDESLVAKVPIEVSVELKGESEIEEGNFSDLSAKIRDVILSQKQLNVNEIRLHYNISDKYVGLYLDMAKEDFASTNEQLKGKVTGHFHIRG